MTQRGYVPYRGNAPRREAEVNFQLWIERDMVDKFVELSFKLRIPVPALHRQALEQFLERQK